MGRFGAICAQLTNGVLVGPPPHIVELLVITASSMAVGCIAVLCLPTTSKSNVDEESTPLKAIVK